MMNPTRCLDHSTMFLVWTGASLRAALRRRLRLQCYNCQLMHWSSCSSSGKKGSRAKCGQWSHHLCTGWVDQTHKHSRTPQRLWRSHFSPQLTAWSPAASLPISYKYIAWDLDLFNNSATASPLCSASSCRRQVERTGLILNRELRSVWVIALGHWMIASVVNTVCFFGSWNYRAIWSFSRVYQ